MILDYSLARPTVAQLKAHNVTAVGRYLGWDGVPGYSSIGKNLTFSEARMLLNAGIGIFLAFEYAADAPKGGDTQGAADGALAAVQLRGLGAPPGVGVYFACDWDVPDYAPALPDIPANARRKLGPVAHYFDAVHIARNTARLSGVTYQVGGYGGYWVIKRLFDAGLIELGWQARAWSGTPPHIDPRAVLYQDANPPPIPFTDTDIRLHAATRPDFGQWPRPAAPKPPSASKELDMIVVTVDRTTLPNDPVTGKPVPWPGMHTWNGTDLKHIHGQEGSVNNAINLEAVLPVVPISYGQYVEWGGK